MARPVLSRQRPTMQSVRVDRRSHRGFTLVEMLTVVIIVGVLASLATYGIRTYIFAAKTSEAVAMMPLIKGAQEAYRAETFTYFDVSADYDDTFPMADFKIGTEKYGWGAGGTLGDKWRTLGVETADPVQYGYVTKAAAPATALVEPTLPSGHTFGFPDDSSDPSYIVIAKGDVNGNGKYSYVISHSFTSEVYIENEGE